MKGSAGFLQLNALATITHEAETILDRIRKGRLSFTPQVTDLLCSCIDLLRTLLDDIDAEGSDERRNAEVQRIVRQLEEARNLPGTEPKTSPAPPASPSRRVEPEPVSIDPERFGDEAGELLSEAEAALLRLTQERVSADDLAVAYRALHSFKGGCGLVGLGALEQLSHAMETVIDALGRAPDNADENAFGVLLQLVDVLRDGVKSGGEIPGLEIYQDLLEGLDLPETEIEPEPEPEPAAVISLDEEGGGASGPQQAAPAAAAAPREARPGGNGRRDIRVNLEKLDALMNLVGELVIAESMVTRNPDLEGLELENFDRASHQLRRVASDLQDVAMSVRMVPLSTTFRRMVRLVHDLSSRSGKPLRLDVLGEETEVDKTVIEQISDPLIHLVRNAADHGIESPEARAEAGKPETGTITIEGRHEGGEVWILVRDDGKGLDRDRILEKARSRGIIEDDGAQMRDEEVFKLIFEPGFSTAEAITDVSGRGVGMDVVKKNIERLKGRVDVRSEPGRGSTFVLRIPLTMAIIDGMLVRVGDTRYTIPTLAIRETLQPARGAVTRTSDGVELLRSRNEFIPVLRLHELFERTPEVTDLQEGIILLIEEDGRSVALFVDEIVGQQQAVIKGLSSFLGRARYASGCTILGNGEVSLILDAGSLIEASSSPKADPAPAAG
jgi:two-component system chemotaxis sensor kinase CheA